MRKYFRPFGDAHEREYFLLVCEAEKTEPNYFNGFKSCLQKDRLSITIIGRGGDTGHLLNEAIKQNQARLRRQGVGYDQVWIIFDKDDFPGQKFNDAIFRARELNIHPAYSNECFELWLLLYFEYIENPIERKRYCEKLKQYLGSYEKNDPEIFHKLQNTGNGQDAIKRAKQLYTKYDHSNPGKENPSTTVFELVEELLREDRD